MADDGLGLDEPGTPEGPDLVLGPSPVPAGRLSDGSLSVPPGVDPMDDYDQTPDEGEPDPQAITDAGAQTAPEGPTDPDPQASPDATGDTPPAPWEGQHPDKLDLASMTTEQYVQWATENPEAARRYALRQDDYTKKAEELARQREALEQERREFDALRAQTTPQQQQSGAPQDPSQQQSPTDEITQVELANYLKQQQAELGREPLEHEFLAYVAIRKAREIAESVVAPLRQQVDETTNQARQRQMEETRTRLAAEFEALVNDKPQAATPERQQAIYDYLNRHQSLITEPGAIRHAYNALFADADAAAMKQGRNHARQQQAARSQQAPTVPPSGQGGEPLAPPVDLGDFYEKFAQPHAARGTLLDVARGL
jgi:hypothetical protein